jgi:hypothetical protein
MADATPHQGKGISSQIIRRRVAAERFGLEFRDSEEAVFPHAVIAAAFTPEVQPLWI